jgi:hypothetical protein
VNVGVSSSHFIFKKENHMKNNSTKGKILYAAIAGLFAVSTQAGCGKPPAQTPAPAPEVHQPVAQDAGEKNACKGTNECGGKGGCAVEGQNECKGKNPCKGKGGCKMS